MSALPDAAAKPHSEAAPTMLRAVFQFPNPSRGQGMGGHVAAPLAGKYPEQNLEWIRAVLRDAGDELFGHDVVAPGEEQPVQWAFTRNSIAMEGIGEEGGELVDTYWKAVHRKLIKETGLLLRVELQHRPMAATLLGDGRVRRYQVGRLIVGSSLSPQRANALVSDAGAMKERLKETIYRSLKRRARAFGLSTPPFAVSGIGWAGHTFIRAVHRNEHWALMAQRVRFTSTLQLQGEWRIGGLSSKGYGVVRVIPFEGR